jgi:hypothetical protein
MKNSQQIIEKLRGKPIRFLKEVRGNQSKFTYDCDYKKIQEVVDKEITIYDVIVVEDNQYGKTAIDVLYKLGEETYQLRTTASDILKDVQVIQNNLPLKVIVRQRGKRYYLE